MSEEPVRAETSVHPWESLREALAGHDTLRITAILGGLEPHEKSLTLSRLSEQERSDVLGVIEPSTAAEVIGEVHQAQAADIIGALPPEQAAAIVDEIPRDLQTDLLSEMSRKSAEAILDNLPTTDAAEVRELLTYPPFTAGGLMDTRMLAYRQETTVGEVMEDLKARREHYEGYQVRYIYVITGPGKLCGVMQMSRLVFAPPTLTLDALMTRTPRYVDVLDELDALREFFRENNLYGVPVTDSSGVLLGVLTPDAVEKAAEKKAVRQFLRISGIVGGEEFRTMPLMRRSGRRLSWLTMNIILNVIAASVIAYYQQTLEAVIALAVFLPMISDMSGCSGNQAVAVSMRELTLGLVRPAEVVRVLFKEMSLGLINGFVLGLLLGALAYAWKGNPWLGLVVGVALMANTVVAVSIGGILPLVLKKLRMDPALVASPILTTVTDMCGFFLVLGLASRLIERLA